MKRKIFLIFFIVFLAVKIFATEQVPDILIYKHEKLYLQTGWGHPSPFETYFLQNNIDSPFKMLSTANYRGFIASWEIKGDKLYLTYIDDKKSKSNQLHKIFKNTKSNAVFANWFSGMIVAENFSYLTEDAGFDSFFNYYIYVKKGIVQKVDRVSISELAEKKQNLSPSIKEMISLNYRYISYYYRLWSNDSISYKNEKARLIRKRGTSPIFVYYSEDNLLWPYNWENEEISGAPHCDWNVEKNKIYLTNVSLYSGTSFNGPDIINLPLNKLFSDVSNEHGVFASWLNGVFIIQYGHEVKDGYFTKFEATENILINVKNGLIVEEYILGKDFDFSKNGTNYPRNIKNLLDQL